MSPLEKDITKKEQVDENVRELEFNTNDSKEYKVKAIRDNAVYAKELEGYLPGLHYLVAFKGYPQEENT